MEVSAFIWTILWNFVVAISIILIVFFSKFVKKKLIKNVEYITATTVWLLLWIIFLGFIPELTNQWIIWINLWIFILIWIFLFYLLELFLHWHHCKDLKHEKDCWHSHHTEHHNNWVLMSFWTFLHNAFHWIILFSAFSVNINFWILTTIAVLLHSIPQNIVNYIMNHNKVKYTYFAAFWWMFWAILTYPFSNFLIENKFNILAIITWWLLYTALADIFPEFKGKWTQKKKVSYLIFILIWIFIFQSFQVFTHSEHNEEDFEHWEIHGH